MAEAPRIFRLILQVSDLDSAVDFYSKLLETKGRPIRGSRVYFDCGSVILAILDPTPGGIKPRPNTDYVYFAVEDLEKVHARAQELGCLSRADVHNENAGDIVKRPWGERSFYVEDPWGNSLCFVDDQTLFTG